MMEIDTIVPAAGAPSGASAEADPDAFATALADAAGEQGPGTGLPEGDGVTPEAVPEAGDFAPAPM